MLLFRGSIVPFTFSLFYELAILVQCLEMEKQCFPAEDQRICYFISNKTSQELKWEDAWITCKENKATLPVISSKVIQDELNNYLKSRQVRGGIWTAARLIKREMGWEWSNGQPFHQHSNLERKGHYTQAVINSSLQYTPELLYSYNYYVCQYEASHKFCKRNGSIMLKHACILKKSDKEVKLFDARNDCLNDGGDLPIIDDENDVEKFGQVFSQFPKYWYPKIWTGLRRAWWIWNTSDSGEEMKYSRWAQKEGVFEDYDCMLIKENTREWEQVACTHARRFVCQTAVESLGTTSPPMNPDLGMPIMIIAGVVIGIVVVLIVVVTCVLVLKRSSRPSIDASWRASMKPIATEEKKSKKKMLVKEKSRPVAASEAADESQCVYAEIPQTGNLQTAENDGKKPQANSNTVYAKVEFTSDPSSKCDRNSKQDYTSPGPMYEELSERPTSRCYQARISSPPTSGSHIYPNSEGMIYANTGQM